MPLPRFDVLVPETLEQACALLNEHREEVRVLAGGTDLLVDLQRPVVQRRQSLAVIADDSSGREIYTTISPAQWDSGEIPRWWKEPPSYLLSLHRLAELKRIEVLPDGRLRIGSLATAREIQRSGEIRQGWTALADGADSLGSPLVRARGTLGGNICNARPAADMVVPSYSLGAELTLQSSSGTRAVALESFITGPGATVLQDNEILTAITFPAVSSLSGSGYYKLAQRKALDISVVGVAAWLELDSRENMVRDVRVALGAVGPAPVLAESVKGELIGKPLNEANIDLAAKAAAADATPIDDHRGSAWYRSQMVESMTRRMLRLALERAGGES